jgi:hypothetical protein
MLMLMSTTYIFVFLGSSISPDVARIRGSQEEETFAGSMFCGSGDCGAGYDVVGGWTMMEVDGILAIRRRGGFPQPLLSAARSVISHLVTSGRLA